MPASAAAKPRMILPPPTTTATWVPSSRTSASCSVTPSILPKSTPKPERSSAKASPESFSSTRSYRGLPLPESGTSSSPAITKAKPFSPSGSALAARDPLVALALALGVLPDPEPGEATDHQLLANLGRVGIEHLLDSLAGTADMGLVKQDDLLVEVLELALDDPLDDIRLLAFRLLGVDFALPLQHVGRHVVAAQVPRVGSRDVQGDAMGELLELVGLGDEVGLAANLDQHAELRRQVRVWGVQVGVDDALGGSAAGTLVKAGLASLPQDLLGLLHVAAGVLQRLLAIHHPSAGRVAKDFDLGGRNLHVRWCSFSSPSHYSNQPKPDQDSAVSPLSASTAASASTTASPAAAWSGGSVAGGGGLWGSVAELATSPSSNSRSHSASGSSSAGRAAIGAAPSLAPGSAP